MLIYDVILRVIQRGGYDETDLTSKINTFFLFGQITQEQYSVLLAHLESQN